MKKVKVVYYASHDVMGIYSPQCFLSSFTGDLKQRVQKKIGEGIDHSVYVPMYRVVDRRIPSWMTEAEYLYYHVMILWFLIYGISLNRSRNEYANLIRLDDQYRFLIVWLLKNHKKHRGEFFRSVHHQAEVWLQSEKPRFPTPLSDKQWKVVISKCPIAEATPVRNEIKFEN